MSELQDPYLKLVATMDQLGAILREIAPAIATYYRALLNQDIPQELAATLTVQMQQLLISNATRKDE